MSDRVVEGQIKGDYMQNGFGYGNALIGSNSEHKNLKQRTIFAVNAGVVSVLGCETVLI